jgi:glutamyl-tRNA reductase
MNLEVVGCSHRSAPLAVRERLAFNGEATGAALDRLRDQHGHLEAVLLSTCNRVEFYLAAESGPLLTRQQVAAFLAGFHQLEAGEIERHLYHHAGEAALRHLFLVTASLDSMVVGEAQILSQVKQAYQLAIERRSTGPLTHAAFHAAFKTARRVAGETAIHERRVSVPSVAVADFAQQIFERFDDKQTLVIGAGEMAEETLRYLVDQGARQILVVNRDPCRAEELALRWHGRAEPWERLLPALSAADLVISTTAATEPVVTLPQFVSIEPLRADRPLFVLDLAVPRDFDPDIGRRPGVYLYCVDDLRAACERNQRERDREMPAALRIVEQETARFADGLHHRATGPIIQQLKRGWEKPKEEELQRLFNKLGDLDPRARDEIRQAFDRLVNKLLHPPMESLRDEARNGFPQALVEALARLFQLKD